ncbi:DedA family protein [Olivibacter sp. XZL3]|uniref:DedA family protein n=1 Tax=Olivibacter sp. XZL3 TaxID=1735116 RepID=UPI0010654916|nr:VTT domain-containing protein [Olivibacter sp. XZL3]
MLDSETLLNQGGLLFLIFSVYGQIGLVFLFFLPSGGFMFTAGVLIAAGRYHYDLVTLCVLLTIAAIAGNITGYVVGKSMAPYLQKRRDSRFFKQEYVSAAQRFFQKHGAIAISVALFFPVVRTFVPIVAGVTKLQFYRFLAFASLGSVLYVVGFSFCGYLVGKVPVLKPYLNYIIAAIIISLTSPALIRIVKAVKNV